MKLCILANVFITLVNKKKKVCAFIVGLSLLIPITAWAGLGAYVEVNAREVTPNEGVYPIFTAHATGGSNCWYDYGLIDWNQFSEVGSAVSIYTERKNSSDCYFSSATRWFALFAKYHKDAPWVRISPNIRLYVKGNSKITSLDVETRRSNISLPEGWFYLANSGQFCGLTVQGRWKSYSDISDTGIVNFFLYGALKEGCEVPSYWITSFTSATTEEGNLETNPDEVETINLKVGGKRTFVLKGLDPESVWELGHCEGDAVTSDGVINKHTSRKVLPSRITLRAARSGTETCDVIGWHYPERSKVIAKRVIFNVR